MTIHQTRWNELDARACKLGVGVGLLMVVAYGVITFYRGSIKESDVFGELINVGMNVLPVLTAATGAFIAPQRKLMNGMAAGGLSLLPGLCIALLMLNVFLFIMVIPLAISLVMAGVQVFVGAAIGAYASGKWVVARAPK